MNMFWELRDKELTRFDITNVIMVLSTLYLICFGFFLKLLVQAVLLIKCLSHNLNIAALINNDVFSCFCMVVVLLMVCIYTTKCGKPLIKRYRSQKIKVGFEKFHNEYM